MFEWEKELLVDFIGTLSYVCLSHNKSDDWVWNLDDSGCFSTKTTYKLWERNLLLF